MFPCRSGGLDPLSESDVTASTDEVRWPTKTWPASGELSICLPGNTIGVMESHADCKVLGQREATVYTEISPCVDKPLCF